MYRPPENSNRVRAMKLKFESQDSKGDIISKGLVNVKPKNTKSSVVLSESAIRSLSEGEAPVKATVNKSDSTNSDTLPQTLNRQLSDPVRRNIKRTPAFRLDKNTFIEREHAFQRQASQNNIQSKLDKFKMLNDSSRLKRNCDNIENINLNNNNSISNNQIKHTYKSKSVDEIKNQLYTAFNQKKVNNTSNAQLKPQTQHTSNNDVDQSISDDNNILTSALYASPIPKSLRNKSVEVATENFYSDSHHNKIYERDKNKIETAQNVIEILKNIDLQQYNGSDTIKSALKRPLPPGPAPKKPPRTFQHSPQNHLTSHDKASSKSETNIASLNLEKSFTKELNKSLQKKLPTALKQASKRDPKYMLDKLESALKNNKLRVQRQQKVDYNSEDEVEIKSKSTCSSPLLKRFNDCTNTLASSNFNFNCFPSLGCSKSAYTRIKEPNSSFFVDDKTDEPVYAEPFQYSTTDNENNVPEGSKMENTSSGENIRNSLYYMSSPVVGLNLTDFKDPGAVTTDEDQMITKKEQQCGETSSLSTVSITSDTDSNISLPSEANNGNNIKDLIKSFEERNNSLENDQKYKSNITRKKKLAKTRKINKLDSSEYGITQSDMEENDLSADEKRTRCMNKFEIYVRTVRGFSISKLDNKNLFHCCLLVGLDDRCPYIKSKFPPNVAIPAYIEKFCFPDSEDQRVNYSSKEQNYSLVITDSTGERIYGYCRRVLPEGSCTCLPLAYCILTKNRAPRFYKRILQELESHHGIPDKQRDLLMNEFYKFEFPKPGHTIKINLNKIITNDIKCYVTETGQSYICNNNSNRSSNSSNVLNEYYVVDNTCPHGFLKDQCESNSNEVCELCAKEFSSEIVLTLHQDSRYEETDLKELCESLDVVLLQKVFENLLIERKVIFISCHLSKLSACIEAIQSILYPFSWPHAFIPVLPKSRWEIVEAPAPLICGVLSLSVVNDFKIDHAIIVDLDSNEVLQEMQDDMKILPASSVKIWKKGLELANSVPEEDYGRNVLLGDAFIRVFINTCGHYKEFITNGVFDRDGFKNFPKGKGTRHFLQWFTETTMFNIFIESVLSNPDSFNVFDSRIKIYNSQEATSILEKMKGWRKD